MWQHILQHIDVGLSNPVGIFTNFIDGTLGSLVSTGVDSIQTADVLFPQMPQALDYLHNQGRNGIIHRDIKPQNVLYFRSGSTRKFQLADFGLANWQGCATTRSGTAKFYAPEIYKGEQQTTKADIWSLYYATMAWLLSPDFRFLEVRAWSDAGWK
ncbi:kinase-like domain-containing protein [Xylaria curta]|nr:kinase-like domain-containing protein [Xylaria curta]